ncbi:glycosyl transferase group 1 [Desulfatibacillum aliphaticivorans]|uniref:Glycosyl transferase group 1 n=1 Tax=Desulfatibacillum aliphaticivorans TaxID=218208 RepID=B8F9S4_DESAL|nr:glycosyltransferase family 1 protein [Desulfatibacillum aliphaticivorans]ACL03020.1 glycosyl transferase group 1 [Desulfatibacillum aliphaticivorans]
MNRQHVIGVDASRNRSGGAVAHLKGLINKGSPEKYNIRQVHLWTYKDLADTIPEKSWLVKHTPVALEKPLYRQLWWQRFQLPMELGEAGCEIVFNTDAGSICNFKPSVTLSQDMLSYEPGQMKQFGLGKARIRLEVLKHVQNNSLGSADGSIFLSQYAADVIQQYTGRIQNIALIPHGISGIFKNPPKRKAWPSNKIEPIECVYVSPTSLFKHQWVVVRAIEKLRRQGHNLQLKLVGGGGGKAIELLKRQLSISDPDRKFVKELGFVPYEQLPEVLAASDVFIFASSCENMPNSLIEPMAVGLPIACSDRGPMPEILSDAGIYFDPEIDDSIARAVRTIVKDEELRLRISNKAKALSEQYTWERCANETWAFISDTLNRSL